MSHRRYPEVTAFKFPRRDRWGWLRKFTARTGSMWPWRTPREGTEFWKSLEASRSAPVIADANVTAIIDANKRLIPHVIEDEQATWENKAHTVPSKAVRRQCRKLPTILDEPRCGKSIYQKIIDKSWKLRLYVNLKCHQVWCVEPPIYADILSWRVNMPRMARPVRKT